MKITPTQARAVAKLLYPQEYADNQWEALLKTLEFLKEFDSGAVEILAPKDDLETQDKSLMKRLSKHMNAKGMSVNQLAAELEVHPATLRTWLLGSYAPRIENVGKIRKYLKL